MVNLYQKREKRKKRVRAKIFGTKERPRLCVFRSNKHIYAQLIDDSLHHTILSASSLELKEKHEKNKIKIAFEVGKLLAQKAIQKNIKKVVFDRGPYKYHGRVKALAEGARAGGLEF